MAKNTDKKSVQNYTREELRFETACYLVAEAMRVNTIYGDYSAHRLLEIPATGNGFLSLPPEDLNVSQYELGRVMNLFYDYGYEARFPVGYNFSYLEDLMENAEDFILSDHSDRFYQFMREVWHRGGRENPWGACKDLIMRTRARMRLDSGDSLDLTDLAILANMTEKSVRNAISAEGERRLHIESSPYVSGVIWVDNQEAQRWLKDRRGFKPTQRLKISPDLAEHPDRLATPVELAGFILKRLEAIKNLDDEREVSEILGLSKGKAYFVTSIGMAGDMIDPEDCEGLAKTIKADARWLTEQVMWIRFPKQMEMLLGSLKDQEHKEKGATE